MEPTAGWPRSDRSASWAISVAVLVAATVFSFLAIDDYDSTYRATALVAVLLSVHAIGLAIGQGLRPAPSTRPPAIGVTDQGERGMAFRYAGWPYYWGTASLVLGVLFLALFAVDLARAGGGAWAVAAVFAGF